MRLWQRVLLTVILAPLLWRLGVAYIASQQGSAWGDLARQSLPLLATVFITFTLPALLLCAILIASDTLLHVLGLDLLTVLVSPLIGWGLAASALLYIHEPHVQAAQGTVALAIFYGLVWGLSVREPRPAPRRPAVTPLEVEPSA